jgi:hypothetical protein
VEDIVVVLVMMGLAAWSGDSQQANFGQEVLMVVIKGTAFLGILGLAARYLLPSLLHLLARSTELLILFAITWAIALRSLGEFLGFSKEVGAFLAGVALASTPYRAILGARLVSLRDFLLLFFFIDLGVHIDIDHLGNQLGPAIAFSLFVLIGKPMILMALVGSMGYRKYTSAITSLTLSQISEFSLILVSLGVSLGHINQEVMGLVTLVGLVTMGLSTYAILYSHILYKRLAPWLGIFERQIPHPEETLGDWNQSNPDQIDVILFGLGRYGGNIVQDLHRYGLAVLGVDFDPELVKFWRTQALSTLYGDAEDPEFAAALPLHEAKWVVSAAPGLNIGLTLLHAMKNCGFTGRVTLTSHSSREIDLLERAGADVVLCPFRDAAQEAARTLVALAEATSVQEDRGAREQGNKGEET